MFQRQKRGGRKKTMGILFVSHMVVLSNILFTMKIPIALKQNFYKQTKKLTIDPTN